MAKSQSNVKVRIKPRTDIEPPKLFKVIILNDEITTMDFVIEVLTTVFDYDVDSAIPVMEKIHENGSAVVGVYPFEIAEHKGVEVTLLARANSFPLQIKIEPE